MKELDYPYIRAWHKMTGAYAYYTLGVLAKARKDKAPDTAIYKNQDGEWRTFDDIGSDWTKQRVQAFVERISKGEG